MQKCFCECLLPFGLKEQRGAWNEQWPICESLRGVHKEIIAGTGEGQHGGWSIVWLERGGRPSGGVETRAVLHFEDSDALGFSEVGCHRCTGDACTHHNDVKCVCHGLMLASLRGLRQMQHIIGLWLPTPHGGMDAQQLVD